MGQEFRIIFNVDRIEIVAPQNLDPSEEVRPNLR